MCDIVLATIHDGNKILNINIFLPPLLQYEHQVVSFKNIAYQPSTCSTTFINQKLTLGTRFLPQIREGDFSTYYSCVRYDVAVRKQLNFLLTWITSRTHAWNAHSKSQERTT
jgi:hypothetical protein